MNNLKKIVVLLFVVLVASAVTAERLPTVGGDSGSWGTVLNEFLNVSHNESGELRNDTVSGLQIVDGAITDADISDATNLTLGKKITFAFGEMIDNIVNGIMKITGNLEVTDNITADNFFGNWNGSSLYIPYTGAAQNVDLGANNFSVNTDTLFVDEGTGRVGIGTTSPNATLDVQGNIHVNSSILSPTGTLTLGGTGGTNNNSIALDFESSATQNILTQDVAVLRMDIQEVLFPDLRTYTFGDGADFRMRYQTTGNDNMQMGTRTSTGAYLSLMERDDMGNANRSPLATSADPVFRVYSSDATQANDYIEMYHDQDDGVITTGSGGLFITPKNNIVSFKNSNALLAGRFIFHPTFTQFVIAPHDLGGNQIIIANSNVASKAFDHNVQTNPTLYIHSDTNPDDDNTEWLSMAYINATDYARIETGKGDLALMPVGNVGIGTTTPNAKLDVNATSGTALNVQGGDIVIDLS